LVQVIQGLVIMILLAFDTTAWIAFRNALWTSPPPENRHTDSIPAGGERSISVAHHR